MLSLPFAYFPRVVYGSITSLPPNLSSVFTSVACMSHMLSYRPESEKILFCDYYCTNIQRFYLFILKYIASVTWFFRSVCVGGRHTFRFVFLFVRLRTRFFLSMCVRVRALFQLVALGTRRGEKGRREQKRATLDIFYSLAHAFGHTLLSSLSSWFPQCARGNLLSELLAP